MQKIVNEKLNIRYSRSSLILFESVIGLILTPYLIIGFQRPAMITTKGIWIPILICLATGVVIFIWLNNFEIEVENNILKYSSLFGKKKEVVIKDIIEARIEIGGSNYLDRFRPTVKLVIIADKPECRIFYINLKVFDKKDIKSLLKLLPVKKNILFA